MRFSRRQPVIINPKMFLNLNSAPKQRLKVREVLDVHNGLFNNPNGPPANLWVPHRFMGGDGREPGQFSWSQVHHLDAKVGGAYKMSFTNFTTGKSHSFGGIYQELMPQECIRYADKFDDANLPGEMQTMIALKQVFCGTKLNISQEGVPGAIPAEACYLDWQESLTLLAELVETEIPDQL